MLDNLKAFTFKLDDSDMEEIKKLDRNLRKIDPVRKLNNGEMERRDQYSPYYAFEYVETEECLK